MNNLSNVDSKNNNEKKLEDFIEAFIKMQNSKKKLTYMKILSELACKMNDIRNTLKSFFGLSIISVSIQIYQYRFNPEIVSFLGIMIIYIILILSLDCYYQYKSRWFRNIYERVAKIREDNKDFVTYFVNKFDFCTDTKRFQQYQPNKFKCFMSKSSFIFYIPILLAYVSCLIYSLCYKKCDDTILKLVIAIVLVIIMFFSVGYYLWESNLKKRTNKTIFTNDVQNMKGDIKISDVNEQLQNNPELLLYLGWSNKYVWKNLIKNFFEMKNSTILSIIKKTIEQPIDCDLSVVICKGNGVAYTNIPDYLKNVVCFQRKYYKDAIVFNEDNTIGTESQSDEEMTIKLSELDDNVKSLHVLVNIYNAEINNQYFEMIDSLYIKLINSDNNIQLIELNMDDMIKNIEKNKGNSTDKNKITGMEVIQLVKTNNRWEYTGKTTSFTEMNKLEQIINKYNGVQNYKIMLHNYE